LSFPLPLREGARGRGKLKGEPFTLTLSLSRQGRGNSFRISKSGFGFLFWLDIKQLVSALAILGNISVF